MLKIPYFIFILYISISIVSAKTNTFFEIDHRIKIEIETALSKEQQSLGLGNRDFLLEGKGMLFIYLNAAERIFWMKRMRFPLDIIWIANKKIVFIEKNIPPPLPFQKDSDLPTYGKGIVADMVLEVPAGFSDKNLIKVGQVAIFSN